MEFSSIWVCFSSVLGCDEYVNIVEGNLFYWVSKLFTLYNLPHKFSYITILQSLWLQVMAVHNNIRFLHIGCDEVFQMGECPRCRMQARDTLFLSFVSKVAQYVRSKNANVVPLIWDDMLRHLPPVSLEQYHIGDLVEPMVTMVQLCIYISTLDKYSTRRRKVTDHIATVR